MSSLDPEMSSLLTLKVSGGWWAVGGVSQIIVFSIRLMYRTLLDIETKLFYISARLRV